MNANFTKTIFDSIRRASVSCEPSLFEVRNPLLDEMGVRDQIQYGSGDLIATRADRVIDTLKKTAGLEDVKDGLGEVTSNLKELIRNMFGHGDARHWPAFVWASPLYFSVPSMVENLANGRTFLPTRPNVRRPRSSPSHTSSIRIAFSAGEPMVQLDRSGIRFAYYDNSERAKASLAMMHVRIQHEFGKKGFHEIYSERIGQASSAPFDRRCMAAGEFPDHVLRVKNEGHASVRLISLARLKPRFTGRSGWWQEVQFRIIPEDGAISVISAGQCDFEFVYDLLYQDLSSATSAGFRTHTYPGYTMFDD